MAINRRILIIIAVVVILAALGLTAHMLNLAALLAGFNPHAAR